MNKDYTRFLDYCDRNVTESIMKKYNLSCMEAFRKYIYSKTYRMVSNFQLRMWEFAPDVIFDMWECEQQTGEPRNSIYIKED